MDPNDQNLLGAQDPSTPDPKTAGEEAWHREMYRRSFDTIRVRNPQDQDYFVEWDHRYHRVPANGTADVPRFVAVKFCRDMKDKIIHEMGDQMHAEAIEERKKKGLPAFNNKYEENYATYMTDPFPKTNDWNLAAKIYADLWVGLVNEWGKDTPTYTNPRAGEVDIVAPEQKLLDTLQNKRVEDTKNVSHPPTEPDFTHIPENPFKFSEIKDNLTKDELAKEVTADDNT